MLLISGVFQNIVTLGVSSNANIEAPETETFSLNSNIADNVGHFSSSAVASMQNRNNANDENVPDAPRSQVHICVIL